ncbi:hypothetical protein ACEPAI_4048 [Sanghuangporus weigelae]
MSSRDNANTHGSDSEYQCYRHDFTVHLPLMMAIIHTTVIGQQHGSRNPEVAKKTANIIRQAVAAERKEPGSVLGKGGDKDAKGSNNDKSSDN